MWMNGNFLKKLSATSFSTIIFMFGYSLWSQLEYMSKNINTNILVSLKKNYFIYIFY